MTFKVLANGKVETTTNDEKIALLSFQNQMETVLGSSEDEKLQTIEFRDYGNNATLKVTREIGKIKDDT